MNKHNFNYRWRLADGYPESHGLKVFGTFICGGGSTMGYKLAGFNHLGGVEIDPEVAQVYKLNHKPKHFYEMDIRKFNQLENLPEELYDLDILDGSPPCSTFSMAGSREEAWGKQKKFREGQAMQSLDDLVFIYCDTIIKLKPKVFLLENVKGIIQGNAKLYSKKIVDKMTKAGYTVKVFCLNAASMGVPQKRERVFFIGHRNDLKLPPLKLNFNEKPIVFGEVESKAKNVLGKRLSDSFYQWWKLTPKGKSLSTVHPKGSYFQSHRLSPSQVINTITGSGGAMMIHHTEPFGISDECLQMCGTYPIDFDFNGIEPKYLIGMSVPPIMTAQIAREIAKQWFKVSFDK